jgi:hypothetical protein
MTSTPVPVKGTVMVEPAVELVEVVRFQFIESPLAAWRAHVPAC